jgi:hypothetical protein
MRNQIQIVLFLALATMMPEMSVTAADQLPDPDGKPADITKKVKVFIIMGQSNTLEMSKVKGDKEGSLEYAVKTEKSTPSWSTTRATGPPAKTSATCT